MAVSASLVKELRERTGAGMLDCKKALEENNGDIDAAITYLREKGIAKAAKKAGRTAAEGLVFGGTSADMKTGVVLEFNSETDFVARNEEFINFGNKLVEVALNSNITTVEELLETPINGKAIKDAIAELVAKIGENMNLRRIKKVSATAFATTYIHLGGKIGVLLNLDGEATEENIEIAKDIAMHVAAMDPKYLDKSQVTTQDLETEKEIARKQLKEEGKPANIIEKILEGKMRKYYEEACLLQQKFVKDDKVSIEQYAGKMKVLSYDRFKVGEGIVKEEVDFAAEVAAQVAGK